MVLLLCWFSHLQLNSFLDHGSAGAWDVSMSLGQSSNPFIVTLLIALGSFRIARLWPFTHMQLFRKQEASHFISLTNMGICMRNSHSRHQDILPDVLHQSVSCLWVINFAVGLHRALNLQEDCSCGSAEPWATVGMARFIHSVLPVRDMLCPLLWGCSPWAAASPLPLRLVPGKDGPSTAAFSFICIHRGARF